jgi:nucleoside phosphorylase
MINDVNSLGSQDILEREITRLITLGDQCQFEGNYQEATTQYLGALERSIEAPNRWARAVALSRLGDILTYTGHYPIAVEFYKRQFIITHGSEYSSDIDYTENLSDYSEIILFYKSFAFHKLGSGYYYIGFYALSLELQDWSLRISSDLPVSEKNGELKCKSYSTIGLTRHALGEYETAIFSYEAALEIAESLNLLREKAENFINLSASTRKKRVVEGVQATRSALDKVLMDLGFAYHVSSNNPYLKSSILLEFAKIYEEHDIDLSLKHCQDALEIANRFKLNISRLCQEALDQITRTKISLSKNYEIQEQPWQMHSSPFFQQIDDVQLQLSEFKADFVIMTARPTELRAVTYLLEPCENEKSPFKRFTNSGIYYLGKLGACNVVVTQCRIGTRDERGSTIATVDALDLWKPKAVIMVGIAFGKDSGTQDIADVLVASEIFDYEVQRVGVNTTVNRGGRLPSSRILLGLFEQAHEWKFERPDRSLCRIISGPILSGEKLVDNPGFKADLLLAFPEAEEFSTHTLDFSEGDL